MMKSEYHSPDFPTQRAGRRGVSLVETMVVMTIMGAVLTVAMTGLSRLFHAQSNEVQSLQEAVVWQRLAHDLRTDAHSAHRADLTDTEQLDLQTHDGLITWRVAEGTVERMLKTTSTTDPASATVEHYRLPFAGFDFGLAPSSDGTQIVQLSVSRSGDARTRPTAGRIEAVVGLSLRFQQRPAEGGTR